jgi:hypothetical protein
VVVAVAVVGSALTVATWPKAARWMGEVNHSSGVSQADAFGLAGSGAHRRSAGRPAEISPGAYASEQPVVVSVAVAARPGQNRPGYLNPLRAISGLVPERIDEGVDFGGTGPIYAIGDAVVTNAGENSGWPGGGWITYQLTDGPGKGLVVYVAEDVTATVQAGQRVTPDTVIANMFAGADGIETGWAQPTGVSAESELSEAGGISGGGPFPTAIGVNFDELLHALGVPAAPNIADTIYGTLPVGYPGWK